MNLLFLRRVRAAPSGLPLSLLPEFCSGSPFSVDFDCGQPAGAFFLRPADRESFLQRTAGTRALSCAAPPSPFALLLKAKPVFFPCEIPPTPPPPHVCPRLYSLATVPPQSDSLHLRPISLPPPGSRIRPGPFRARFFGWISTRLGSPPRNSPEGFQLLIEF